jgi:uncharacterized membrane protein
MGPADPFGDTAPQPGIQPAPQPVRPFSPALTPVGRLPGGWAGFALGALFGLLGLLVGFPKASLVLLCGLLGALLGGLIQRRHQLLRWIARAAERAA